MTWDHKQSVKEVLRHVSLKLNLAHVLDIDRRRRGFIVAHLDETNAAQRFDAIYQLGTWGNTEKRQSLSGVGSEIAATGELRKALPPLLARLECRTLLDVGCGDWNWMQDIGLPCAYTGIDIVPNVIAQNARHVRPGVEFAVADAASDPLPQADVVLCREMLFHLSFADTLAVLANVRKSGRWLLATTDTSVWFNSDIRTGDFRKVNLQRPPYSLPAPREVLDDSAVSAGRKLGLWATADLGESPR